MAYTRHNGYTNYETWVYGSHINNHQQNHEAVLEMAWDAIEHEYPRTELADRLKQEAEEKMPEIQGVYFGLLNSAIQSINWDELADKYLCKIGPRGRPKLTIINNI